MFIPDPGSRIPDPGSRIPVLGSRISDPGSKNEWQGWKKICCHNFFWSHKFHKIKLFYFWNVEEKIWPNFQRIIELFTQKIVTKLLKMWVWDPGSEIRGPGSGKDLFRIPDPGSRGQNGTGSRLRIRNTDFNAKSWYLYDRSSSLKSGMTGGVIHPGDLCRLPDFNLFKIQAAVQAELGTYYTSTQSTILFIVISYSVPFI